jgi:uncharacterized phage infection (PIP) family protein YhgE
MARDKLITIRIEGEKREAFNQLAKSQNTDTASLLYDFINQCLDGRIDISLVTGKKQWIDKIDNQLDTNRLDKLEATTQRIDNRLDTIAKRLDDWIEAIDDRLSDCDRELSEKITSLEHRLNALSIQLNSQEIDRIDTDSQQIDDMEPLTTKALKLDHLDVQGLIDAIERQIEDTEIDESDYEDEPDTSPLPPNQETVETADTVEPDLTVEPVTGEAVTIKPWYTIDDLLDCHYPGWPETKEGLRKKAKREHWPKRTRRGSKGNPYEYQAVLPD